MWELLNRFFSTQFIPHGHCYLWQTPLVGLHLISDLVIVLAYFSIPLLLFYFIRQRQDVPFNRIFILFSAFIFSCGLTHLMSVITLWYPLYWVSGVIKAASGLISLVSAIELYHLMPQLLTIPSPQMLRQANQSLQQEIKDRQQIETKLRESKQLLKLIFDTLPQRVFWKDINLNYLGCNQKFAEDVGVQSIDEIVGKNDFDIMCEEMAYVYRNDDKEVIETGLPKINYEEPLYVEDGKILWLKTSKIPLRNSDGEIFGVFGSYEDISDRRVAEAELKKSQKLLRRVIDNIPQYIFWKDIDLVYLGCNQKFAELVGFSDPQQLVGKTDNDLNWTKTEAQLYRQRDREVIEKNQPDLHRIEQRSSANASLIWVENSKIPLHNHEGNVIGVLGTYEDITARRIVDEALRSSQQDLQTIFDNVYEAIFIHNLPGKIIDVNQTMLTMFGVTKEQALQLSIEKDLSASQNASHQLQKFWQRAISGKQILFEWKARKVSDGSLFDVEVFLRKVRLNNQDVLLANVRDITIRKQTEIALKHQLQLAAFRAEIDMALTREETLFEILKHCTDAIVKHLNAAFARIWIFNPTENVLELQASSGMYTHLNGEHSQIKLGECKIGRIAQTRQPHLVNHVLSDPQITDPQWAQREGMVAFAGYPLIVKDRLFGVIALFARYQLPEKTLDALSLAADEIALGISRKQAEIALQQSEAQLRSRAAELQQTLQQLEQTQTQLIQSEKMSALGQMMAGIAHEINNPVSFIGGNLAPAEAYLNDLTEHLRLYQQQFPDPGEMIKEHQQEIELDYLLTDFYSLISSMKVGVERIRGISTSLRVFSRADQEQKVLFNIQEGIESTLMILKHRLKATESRPEIHVIQDYQKSPAIACYPGQLNQVFMNILANAIDAFDESPKLSQHYSQDYCQIYIQTELINTEKAVLIRIQDNGPGMSEEIKQKIFDYLFTTKPVGTGTGLGLSISRQIIEQKHQGSLAVCSEVGAGTEFIITLPLSA
ncbi:MAG: PAS domain S-box protein [Microcoleaceae cyanobacterium]